MKLLVLTSRYTAGKDVIENDFGRQIRLLENLAMRHDVLVIAADYKKKEKKQTKLHGMRIHSVPFSLISGFGFLQYVKKTLRKFQPDIILVSGDPLWGAMAAFLKTNVPLVYDIQDNYEVYSTSKIPFVRKLEKKTIQQADLVVTASTLLEKDVVKIRNKKTVSVLNGVNLNLFKPTSKTIARKKLGLPLKKNIIGYFGSMSASRGVDVLVDCFHRKGKNMQLVLIGKADKGEHFPAGKNIVRHDYVTQQDVAQYINALDAVVLPYPDNAFTRVMEVPYKLGEFMACNVPIVVTKAGIMAKVIGREAIVCEPRCESLWSGVMRAVKKGRTKTRQRAEKYSWKTLSKQLEKELLKLVE